MRKSTLTLLFLFLLTLHGAAFAESVDLTWTAPGDDDRVGTATQYDLRYAEFVINKYNWNDATQVVGLPSPRPSGTAESFTVDGLTTGHTYYFALRTVDDAYNWSEISNVVAKTISLEAIAPSNVANLNAAATGQTSVDLTWTAPGDDGTVGTAAQYDLRYAEFAIDDNNWDQATPVAGLATPLSSGNVERYSISGLAAGTTYYFAVKTADEVPNWSGLSNVATVVTPTEPVNSPPAPIADLISTGTTINSVSLSWSATGADGTAGTASAYDLRYATAPITESNWSSATSLAGLTIPQPSGSLESYDISGLVSNTTYYFAIKAADELNQWSVLSNVATAKTLSNTTTSTDITDLAATGQSMTSVSLAWTAPTAAAQYELRFANYAITEDNWNNANRVNSVGAPEPAGVPEEFTVYALTPNIKYYFALKAADQSGAWSALSNVVSRSTGTAIESAAPADVADLKSINVTASTVSLSWTAPGDDGTTGTASQYDLRYALSPITADNWSSAQRLAGVGAPQPSGSLESYDIAGLNSGTDYYFALKTADEVPNWSGISNVVNAQTVAVNLPPGAIADLSGSNPTTSSVTLSWTASGGDGSEGQASSYDLACATIPIDEGNWSAVDHLSGVPAPSAAGTSQSFVVTGLAENTRYYFAIKAVDEIAQWSSMSNLISVVTDPRNMPPSAISTLAATDTTARTVTLTWTVPSDDGSSGSPSNYDLRYATSPITDASWTSAIVVGNLPTPDAAGSQETFTVAGLTPATTYYFAIKSADDASLWSGLSNVAAAETDIEIIAGTTPPADITDLLCTATSNISVSLAWTAPGADGDEGTASTYDLRFANYPITEDNWSTANRVASIKAPKPAGTKEKLTVWGLTPGVEYYFAIKTADEVPTWSNLSNVATAVTGETPTSLAVDFSASVTTGEAPLTVEFISEVTGVPDTWRWDFGDGTQSAEASPSHVYATAGSYTVALTVANANESVTATKADFVIATGQSTPEALHVAALETYTQQYKNWCRGHADVYVVDADSLPVEGATVYLSVSGATYESMSALTDINGLASFKTRVSKNCEIDWCYSLSDISHPWLAYDAPSDVINSTCQSILTIASYSDFDWDGAELPSEFTLEQNYPNPFNPTTEIAFSLPEASTVRLAVINSLGQEVAVLVEGQRGPGWHSVTWNGRTDGGRPVASGLYFYNLQAGEFSESRKMMLLK